MAASAITIGLRFTSLLSATQKPSDQKPKEAFRRPEPISRDIIKKMVGASHSDLAAVTEMLKGESNLANAYWDWGGGDFESALGAASHMARQDIASLLLDHGARKNIFYAAMSGDSLLVKAFVSSDRDIISITGPHGITLLYHAVLSANLDLVLYLHSQGAIPRESDLRAAAMADSYDITEWILQNGVAYDENNLFMGSNIADMARKNGRGKIADLLEANATNK